MRKGKALPPARKPVRLSEWANQAPGAPVTRAQLIQVVQHIIERRFMVETIYRREQAWYRRLWKWLRRNPKARDQPLRGKDFDQAAAAAVDPTTTELRVGPGAEPKA